MMEEIKDIFEQEKSFQEVIRPVVKKKRALDIEKRVDYGQIDPK